MTEEDDQLTITPLSLHASPTAAAGVERYRQQRYDKRWAEHIYDPRWEAWLYQQHPPAELREWATRLRWFRYCRAVGGHANDGDNLRLALQAETEQELLVVLAALGITPVTVPPDAPQPVPGTSYTADEYAAFPQPIRSFPQLSQSGHIRLAGEKAFAWADSGRLELHLSDPDNPYEVTEQTVAAAATIEPTLANLTASIIDPPLDNPYCVCPKYHPHLWSQS